MVKKGELKRIDRDLKRKFGFVDKTVSNKKEVKPKFVISEGSTMETFSEILVKYDKTFKILSDK